MCRERPLAKVQNPVDRDRVAGGGWSGTGEQAAEEQNEAAKYHPRNGSWAVPEGYPAGWLVRRQRSSIVWPDRPTDIYPK
ncbi:MAG: hypothetical protein V2J55_20220 [Candidatus Competibacteraceae bacterium]|nr:hypothetical protein [Candidatus Competibacteraceae bacterium]